MILDSNPASVLNVVLNLVQIAATMYALWMVRRARSAVARIEVDGTKWLMEETMKAAFGEHLSRLYQRIDALAAFYGKEFICNPETLIEHRGLGRRDS
jgi:hypothetical protein